MGVKTFQCNNDAYNSVCAKCQVSRAVLYDKIYISLWAVAFDAKLCIARDFTDQLILSSVVKVYDLVTKIWSYGPSLNQPPGMKVAGSYQQKIRVPREFEGKEQLCVSKCLSSMELRSGNEDKEIQVDICE